MAIVLELGQPKILRRDPKHTPSAGPKNRESQSAPGRYSVVATEELSLKCTAYELSECYPALYSDNLGLAE